MSVQPRACWKDARRAVQRLKYYALQRPATAALALYRCKAAAAAAASCGLLRKGKRLKSKTDVRKRRATAL